MNHSHGSMGSMHNMSTTAMPHGTHNPMMNHNMNMSMTMNHQMQVHDTCSQAKGDYVFEFTDHSYS